MSNLTCCDIVHRVATLYPIVDEITINNIKFKHIMNFSDIYEPEKKLGAGSFGTVTKYREKITGNTYALKEITITPNINIQNLHNEVSVLQALSKNNQSIVRYHDSFVYTANGIHIYVIIMEYIDGLCLINYVDELRSSRSVAPVDVIMNISLWLFETLAYIHANDFIHRDIKLENIMVDKITNRFILVDFGLSCSLKKGNTAECNMNKLIGSPEYIAPELVQPSKKILLKRKNLPMLKKSDVWSAGILIYILVERDYPWNAVTATDLFFQIVGPYSIRMNYNDRDVNSIINGALQRDPNLRPTAETMVANIKDMIMERLTYEVVASSSDDNSIPYPIYG